MKESFLISAFSILVFSTLCSRVWGAQAASSEAGANVVLGGTSGSPGESVVVPIYLRPPEGKEVGSLKLEVTFVSVNLKYVKTEPGIAADMGNVEVKS